MELATISLDLANQAFALQEERLQGHITDLSKKNSLMQITSEVLHRLTLGLKENKELDLNKEESVKELVLTLHRFYPHIFDRVVSGFPEGLLTQPVIAEDTTVDGIVQSALKQVDIHSVTISKMKSEDIDGMIRGLENQLDIEASLVNQTSFAVNQEYSDRKQIVDVMRELLRQMHELLRRINQNARGA